MKCYFQGMVERPCRLMLLHAPTLWLSGLPGPPEDSLNAPRDSGLLAPVVPPATSFPAVETGSARLACFDSFFPSGIKLPTTTWIEQLLSQEYSFACRHESNSYD